MPPHNTMHLRAFELRAGPRSARLVTVSFDQCIADLYPHLCRVLKLDVPINHVTFHKTHDKRVDTMPLPTTTPLSLLGLVDNDIFIVRKGYHARSAAQEDESVTQRRAAGLSESRRQERRRVDSDAAKGSGSDKAGVKAAASPIAAEAEDMINTQRGRVCMATDVQRMSCYQQQLAQYSQMTQIFTLKLFQLLAVLSRDCPTVPFTTPQRGPVHSTLSVEDVHRDLLSDFCRRSRLPASHVDRLLGRGTRDMAAVYDALCYYADVTLPNHTIQSKVSDFLKEWLPPLQPAAQLICILHEGHEAEWLEQALLRLLGHAPTSMTWLCLKDSTEAIALGRQSCCYYSAVVQFSQSAPPTHVIVDDIPVLEAAELDSCCVAWGLHNSSYKGHLLPLSSWMWSRVVAAMMTGRDDASARLCDLLNLYGEWEASLA
jgi:hypothetical protein